MELDGVKPRSSEKSLLFFIGTVIGFCIKSQVYISFLKKERKTFDLRTWWREAKELWTNPSVIHWDCYWFLYYLWLLSHLFKVKVFHRNEGTSVSVYVGTPYDVGWLQTYTPYQHQLLAGRQVGHYALLCSFSTPTLHSLCPLSLSKIRLSQKSSLKSKDGLVNPRQNWSLDAYT